LVHEVTAIFTIGRNPKSYGAWRPAPRLRGRSRFGAAKAGKGVAARLQKKPSREHFEPVLALYR